MLQETDFYTLCQTLRQDAKGDWYMTYAQIGRVLMMTKKEVCDLLDSGALEGFHIQQVASYIIKKDLYGTD